MSRLEQIPPEEMPELIKIASRIKDEEQAQADVSQERKSFVEAAAEMDLPQEYLERAAGELRQTQLVRAQSRSRTRRIVLVACVTVVAIGALWGMMHRPAPQPNVYQFAATQWKLDINPESKAAVSFQNLDGKSNAAVIHIEKFVPGNTDGQYFVNLNSAPTVDSLSRFKSTSFFVKSAGLPNIRLYLEASPTERWRSPAVTAFGDWQQETIDLSQYEHQSRDTPTGQWHKAAADQPGHIDALSFKVGSYMNDVTTSGDIAIDDLEIH